MQEAMENLKKLVVWVLPILLCITTVQVAAVAQDTIKLSDAEIASIAVTANQIDIDNAVLAKEKSKNAEILKFAETMASDHQAVIEQAVALVQKLGVTPEDNAVSQQLQSDAAKTLDTLRTYSDMAFDKAYIANEVAYHKAVIAAVEDLLIPNAENAELKGLLEQVLPTLKAHLMHAEMVHEKFESK